MTLRFIGQVSTVVDQPLGLDDSVRTTAISGSFTYDRATYDRQRSLDGQGEYTHDGDSVFTLAGLPVRITGSGGATVEIQDLDPHTFSLSEPAGTLLLQLDSLTQDP